jgi:hypothetical protein
MGTLTQKTLFVFEHRGFYTVKDKNKTKHFKVTVKTQQQCISISIILWQRVSVLLDHFQVNIQRCKVQSVHIMYYGMPCYLQGVHKNSLKLLEIIYIYIY